MSEKKIAIMQPYFFPYIGYFQLIQASNIFIIFDDAQYIRHGWVNRNRILKPESGWQYINVPLQKHEQTALIKDIKVQNGDWKIKIIRQIEHYKKKAPYYNLVKCFLEDCFEFESELITELNAHYLKKVCNSIELPLNLKISSYENYNYSAVSNAGDWALRICEQVGGAEYINPIAGKDLFDEFKFDESKIKLNFLEHGDISYGQRRSGVIESGLSIIDVMLFNSNEQIHSLLKNYMLY
jgi:hypothetical protein